MIKWMLLQLIFLTFRVKIYKIYLLLHGNKLQVKKT